MNCKLEFYRDMIETMEGDPRVYIGTSGWTYPGWKGSFYPSTLPAGHRFHYYSERFNTVEINATFYRRFPESTFLKWRTQAPPGFRYVLKAPRVITHRKYLVDVERDIEEFVQLATRMEDTLGLFLLQLAPSTPYDISLLRRAIESFPDPTRVAVEFRHPRWLTQETKQTLTELGTIYCDSDSPNSRPLGWITARTGYLRLHGRSKWYSHRYTHEELLEILSWVRGAIYSGARELYIFFNNDFEAYAPQNARELKELLSSFLKETL